MDAAIKRFENWEEFITPPAVTNPSVERLRITSQYFLAIYARIWYAERMSNIFLLQITHYRLDVDNYTVSEEVIDQDLGYYTSREAAEKQRDAINETRVEDHKAYAKRIESENASNLRQWKLYQKQNQTLRDNNVPTMPNRPEPYIKHIDDFDRWLTRSGGSWWDVIEVTPAEIN